MFASEFEHTSKPESELSKSKKTNIKAGAKTGAEEALTLTPTERSLRARIAAYELHSQRDPRETTAQARKTFLASFEQQVDPEGILPPEERSRRAECARRAHFTRLAYLSVRSRRSGKHAGRHKDKTRGQNNGNNDNVV
jgi:hypothetical protein